MSLNNIISPFLQNISESGGLESVIRYDQGLKSGIYVFHGVLTNRYIGEWYNLPHTDINLLVF